MPPPLTSREVPVASSCRSTMHGRPRFAKLSFHDDLKVTIAAMHPDFICKQCLRSLMEFAGWVPITDVHSKVRGTSRV
jgi:hypothetical protein